MRTVVLLAYLLAAPATAREIPLSAIWAVEMPNTHDMLKHAEAMRDDYRTVIAYRSIQERLGKHPKPTDPPPTVFAIDSSLDACLPKAADVVTGKTKRSDTVSATNGFVLFFYSRPLNQDVYLRSVSITKKTIKIEYEFVPRIDRGLMPRFAAIPIPAIAPGDYDVVVTRRPLGKKHQEVGFKSISEEIAARYVCGSFKLRVQ